MARNTFDVSQSKIGIWRRCRYAAHLRYVEKLRRKFKARPLRFGSLAHGVLETEANAGDFEDYLSKEYKAQGRLFASQREELEDIVRDVRYIMTDYFEYWDEYRGPLAITYLRRQKKAAEHEIRLDLDDGITLVVKLDAIALTSEKVRALVEHKTFRNDTAEEHRWRSTQNNIYFWAASEAGIKLDAILMDYIRSKTPTVPKMLKDGGFSKARLDTLPSALRDFFKQHKIKPDARMLEAARQNRKNFYSRQILTPRKAVIKSVLADFRETAREMSEKLGKTKAKTIDRHCEWCEYEPLCRAELTGADTDFIRAKEYQTRDREDKELPQE